MFSDVATELRSRTPPEIWHRGLQLSRDGAVRIEGCDSSLWTFSVRDTTQCEVRWRWRWGTWFCSCRSLELSCAHIIAAALVLDTIGDILTNAHELVRVIPSWTYRLRSDGPALHLSALRTLVDRDGHVSEQIATGDPESGNSIVAALPAGQTEVRLTPELGQTLAQRLAGVHDLRLDGAQIYVDPAPLVLSWLAYKTRGAIHPIHVPPLLDVRRDFSESGCMLIGNNLRFTRLADRPSLTFDDDDLDNLARIMSPLRAVLEALLPAIKRLRPPAPPAGATPALEDRQPSRPALIASDGPPEHRASPPPATPGAGARPTRASIAPTTPAPTLSPHWKADGSNYDVTFRATGSAGEPIELPSAQVLPVWRAGSPTIETKSGPAALPQDWLARYGPILERLHAARDKAGRLQRWGRPVAASLCLALHAVPPPELAGLAALLDDFTAIPAAHLPSGLRVKLRDYQRRGVDWLCLLRDAELGALLADDMGLGKTVQTICALQGRTLIVAPTSTLPNWIAELKRFRPRLKVSLYHGQERRLDPKADVIVTSYTLLRNDKDKLCKHEWDIVVLDEAQAIKEARTVTAGAAFALKARWRLALTGTPIENRLSELWSVCHFLNPGLLGAGKDFVSTYARPIEAGSTAELAELQAKIRPFVLRRRKSEVARELPPRTDIVLTCQLDAHEREVYEALRVAAHEDVARHLKGGGDVIAALELLLRLRQAACHIALVPGQTATRSSKLDLLLDHLVDITADGHRALVFSQWTSLLDLLEPALRTHQLDFVRLDGKTQNREEVVSRFQAANGPPVMLLSLKAGGVGLNLTAADHVYLLDPWWNPAVEDQAADRTHRIGQDRPVFVHRLVAEDTVEQRILDLHQRKRTLAVTAIDGAQTPSLTREDLLELLK